MALDPLFLIPLYAVVGLIIGLLGGMIGIGGGVIAVPFLLFIFDYFHAGGALVPLATGTSLASVLCTTLSSARAQQKRGAIRWEIFKIWLAPMVAGGFFAGRLAGAVSGLYLIFVIAAFLAFTGITNLLLLAGGNAQRPMPGRMGSSTLALGTGFFSAMSGAGGGILVTPILSHHGVPLVQAAATASSLAVPMSFAGVCGYLWSGWDVSNLPTGSLGYVHLPSAISIASISILSAPLGVALAHRLPVAALKRTFGAILLGVSLLLVWRGISGIQ